MKSFVLILALFGASAQAQGLHSFKATISLFNVDRGLNWGKVTEGEIRLKAETSELELTLQTESGRRSLPLKITQVQKSYCGDVYTAEKDDRPADGQYRKLVVTDFTFAACERLFHYLIDVSYQTSHYNRRTGQEVKSDSQFSALARD